MFSRDNNELNTLITAYFGQDYDLIDDGEDTEKKMSGRKSASPCNQIKETDAQKTS
ncbi:hypothetical protein ABW286_20510 [Erwinia papayae]|uniref:Uncharacterized protein n=1 Tax=Erwinia papayae TaxID=206499 RepID=A0ABV3N6R0_9GAMM|nr:hypothetical protein [Erwinia mallotivora]